MDLPNLLGTQHVDHVFGNKFAHLPDPGESFDHNRIDKFLFRETIEIPDRNLFNHFFTCLRYFPYRSSREKRAGWAITVGLPHNGQVGERV
jgi:hypothetical protein